MIYLWRRLFIKNYKNLHDPIVRNKHGILVSVLGIIANIILFVGKLIVGIFTGAISLISDSVNNVADSANSTVSLVGFKMSNKPADKKHPFGYARMEYIAGIIISAIILAVGAQLLYQSIMAIVGSFQGDPGPSFSLLSLIIIAVSIVIKVIVALDNFLTSKLINSPTLKATARDSLNDIVVTSAILISAIITYALGQMANPINIDGWFGAVVSAFVIYSGIRSIIETASPLIGARQDQNLVQQIEAFAKSYPGVYGVHEIAIHQYGESVRYVSLHLEVDVKQDLAACHDLSENIETGINQKFPGTNAIVHIDPVDLDNPEIIKYRTIIGDYIKEKGYQMEFHDLRIVKCAPRDKILFDLTIPFNSVKKRKAAQAYEINIIHEFSELIKKYNKKANVTIRLNHPF